MRFLTAPYTKKNEINRVNLILYDLYWLTFCKELMYCHRKLGPLSKPRLWYNYNLIIRSIRWRNENEEASPPSLKRRLFLRPSAVKVPKRKCAGGEPNLSEDQLSKWKQQLVENAETSLFASTDKQSSEAAERIAHLEQLVGRLTVALDIQKKASAWLS